MMSTGTDIFNLLGDCNFKRVTPMATNSGENRVFICERRDLLKWAAAGSAFMMFADFDEMYAAGVVDYFKDNTAPDTGFTTAATEIFQWIDGPFGTQFGTGFENAVTKVKLAVMVDLVHTVDSYVECVVVTDANRKIIARAAFVPEQATAKGRAPYAVFENISLNPLVSYFIYFVVKKKDVSIVYRFTLAKEKVAQSRLDYAHLNSKARLQMPPEFIEDMNKNTQHLFLDKPELGAGYLTTPYQHFAELPLHNVRFKLKSIAKNGEFAFDIGKMHGDVADAHYMRYFLVLDPVGRILGGLRRNFGDPDAGAASHMITNRLAGIAPSAVGYKPEDLNICDCPYVQIITEDKADALARTTYRLR
jgi:hypothetical protein